MFILSGFILFVLCFVMVFQSILRLNIFFELEFICSFVRFTFFSRSLPFNFIEFSIQSFLSLHFIYFSLLAAALFIIYDLNFHLLLFRLHVNSMNVLCTNTNQMKKNQIKKIKKTNRGNNTEKQNETFNTIPQMLHDYGDMIYLSCG